MTSIPPLIPLNELLQIDATIIAGLLVLLLVTKFLDRPIYPKQDDWLATPRRMVGAITPFFAFSALLIIMIDLFYISSESIGMWARFSTWGGLLALIVILIIIAFTPDQRKSKSVKEKISILARIRNYFCRKHSNDYESAKGDPNHYHDG